MMNDPRVRRNIETGHMVPLGANGGKLLREHFLDRSLLVCAIQLKDAALDEETPWVGMCSAGFDQGFKDRDMWVGIALKPDYWGKGYGTEVMQSLVGYAFKQLAVHRVLLYVFGSNDRQYKRM